MLCKIFIGWTVMDDHACILIFSSCLHRSWYLASSSANRVLLLLSTTMSIFSIISRVSTQQAHPSRTMVLLVNSSCSRGSTAWGTVFSTVLSYSYGKLFLVLATSLNASFRACFFFIEAWLSGQTCSWASMSPTRNMCRLLN